MQQIAKVDALIIETQLKTAAKDNRDSQSILSSLQPNSTSATQTADEHEDTAPGAESSTPKEEKAGVSNAILEHLKRQIILVKEQIAETKQQLASAQAGTEQGNNSAADAISNMLASQQSHLSTLMSQYSKAVQEIAQQSAERLSNTANFVDIKV